ncbi:hypothetical protein IEQ34_019661 [Dendrobium chrysotoxum]|uniref:Transmembrane protein n=1 Tax=Dendrobium chrysotoxum TaxID=161865 RepID=A0AAV7G9D1_DENCH|nr:hypothetical protein IEQ34_019661 [Dendrobium chrysotoxum]
MKSFRLWSRGIWPKKRQWSCDNVGINDDGFPRASLARPPMAIVAKFLIFFVVALLAMLMAESNSLLWANEANDAADQYFPNKNAPLSVTGDARRPNTRNHASSFATSAAASAYVCPQDIMATRGSVPATTTGRPRGAAQNAPKFIKILSSLPTSYLTFCLIYLPIFKHDMYYFP